MVKATPAYITTIRSDRTIELPDDMPVGMRVAVVAMPLEETKEEMERNARFAATLEAIEAAKSWVAPLPVPEGEALDALIRKARKGL